MSADVQRAEGRAMASAVRVVLVDPRPGQLRWALRRIEALELRWSRFLPTSELSALNMAGGATVPVSGDTTALLSAMLEAHELTGGRYDPSVLPALVRTGYRRRTDAAAADPAVLAPGARRRRPDEDLSEALRVDPVAATATLAPGLALDPGGIGKGLAADVVVAELRRGGCGGALVIIGGDLAASGTPPGGPDSRWTLDVEHATGPGRAPVGRLELRRGGVATSSTRSRCWRRGAGEAHHLIDPQTDTTADTDLDSVTVVARCGWLAEVHATAALLLGRGAAGGYLREHGLRGVLQAADGGVDVVGIDVGEVAR